MPSSQSASVGILLDDLTDSSQIRFSLSLFLGLSVGVLSVLLGVLLESLPDRRVGSSSSSSGGILSLFPALDLGDLNLEIVQSSPRVSVRQLESLVGVSLCPGGADDMKSLSLSPLILRAS